MLTLYDYGNSVCCQKVRITLREKGLDWEAIRVDLFASEQYDPKYLKLNPKGVAPTLVHDGIPLIESDPDLRIPRRDVSRPSAGSERCGAARTDAAVEQVRGRRLVRRRHRDQLFGDVSRAHEEHGA